MKQRPRKSETVLSPILKRLLNFLVHVSCLFSYRCYSPFYKGIFTVPPPSKQPPPPVPTFPRLHTDAGSSGSNGSMLSGDRTSGSLSPSTQQMAVSSQMPSSYQNPDARSADMNSRPESRPTSGSIPGQPYIRTSASAQPFPTGNPSLEQYPNITPARSTGFVPNSVNEPPAGPNFLPPNPLPGHFPNFPVSHSTNYPNGGFPPSRPPSDPSIGTGNGVRKMLSARSLNTQYSKPAPALPSSFPSGYQQPHGTNQIPRNNMQAPQPRPILPSEFGPRSVSVTETSFNEPSPPNSPIQQPQDLGPVVSTISAQMKCKVFLQQQHAQWKSLGSAKLKLYCQNPTNIKQLVVEADNRGKSILISTIVLTDGVERVGKTGIAIELSDKGSRTGIIYMIQLRNETSAGGLFNSLLAGSDRAARG